jgi:hypothetical protein
MAAAALTSRAASPYEAPGAWRGGGGPAGSGAARATPFGGV